MIVSRDIGPDGGTMAGCIIPLWFFIFKLFVPGIFYRKSLIIAWWILPQPAASRIVLKKEYGNPR
jgi:hypothetical protein